VEVAHPVNPPQLSVVIASHNRSALLRRCLDSLRGQSAEPDSFETIVADDGSSDGTAAMVEAFEAPFRLRLLRLEQGGQAAAQNAAIGAAEGAVCLFLDDDMIASPDLVAAHLAAHRREPMTLAVGRLTQEPVDGNDPYAHAFARRWNARYEELATRELDWADCYGGNLSAPRATLHEIGGFATDLPSSEDLEVSLRICRAGCVPRYLPEAHAVHDDQKPGRTVLAHERRFGAFSAAFARARPDARRRLLGWFEQTTTREIALRRLLLALRLPPRWLVAAGRLVPSRGRDVWFGFVSRYTFWRGVRGAMSRDEWWQTTRGVPVLMYHAFTESGERDRYVLPKRSFARQMRLLAALRYRTISFEQLGEMMRNRQPLPRRTVVVTIDDGYRDNYEFAFPVLRRHGFSATVFLVSQRIGASNDWGDKGAVSGRPTLTREQIESMRAGGIEFGAHTRTHCRLSEADEEEIATQVAGSRQDLGEELGASVDTFAYPYGLYDERVVRATGEAGFLTACTTWVRRTRLGDDPLRIPRIEVEGPDSLLRFLRKLAFGGY
jgi:peptidoglycan/xylan/chitin deacetylase (PgdA/CDA1 family)/GT2 family glycosyltransferase